MAYDDEHIEEARTSLGPGQKAWCGLMLLVILASAGSLGAFLKSEMNPESGPILRMELADLTPQPGFDI